MTLIAYIGNFGPEHSTENDVRRTLLAMGHRVTTFQENDRTHWDDLIGWLGKAQAPDVILWTSTHDYAEAVGHEVQAEMLYRARAQSIPTVGFHLDRWWGLDRWRRVLTQPFFRCQYVLTADGGHQDEFAAAGVNHIWSPPAIAPHNAVRGTYRSELACDVAFVGSWAGGYHEEWQHRPQLIKHLRRHWPKRLELWGSGRSIRGQDLADLYASAKVVVGDSCLVPKTDGSPMTHYCSDRVFETIGRGGLLIHPFVYGVTHFEDPPPKLVMPGLVTHGQHMLGWGINDWSALDGKIEWALDEPTAAEDLRRTGHAHVTAHHTYANRLQAALELVGP